MQISIKDLTKNYCGTPVFERLNILFEANRIACILGPSGCGKTTLLNVISGLEKADEGNVEGVDPGAVSYLFQEPRLLPWKTVWDNVAFVLKGISDVEEMERMIESNLRLVGLWDYRDYYPAHLSGGMKQRVAIARAFAYPSRILLMDEPFKGLDPKLKSDLIKAFLDLWRRDRRTVVFVTHEIDEAIAMGHTIYVLSNRPAEIKKYISLERDFTDRSQQNDEIMTLKQVIQQEFN